MKRSHAILLGATGVILAGAWLGSGSSSEDKDAALYNDVDECIRAGVLSGDACRDQFRAASERHEAAAPKFPSQSACETEYGASQCRQTTFNGASVFIPAMIGFMVANHLSGSRQAQALMSPLRRATPCPPGQTPETMPGCYAPRQQSSSSSSSSSGSSSSGWRSWSTSSGDTVSRKENAPGGVAKVPSSAATAPAARTAIGAIAPRSGGSSSFSSSSSSSSTSRGGFGSTGHSMSSSS